MADHHELVAEMSTLEQMGTQERQKLAKKRRLQQLKKWSHREKEWIAKEKQVNKRLASILHEENNGLNLKQYTTYSSNHRQKKKIHITSSTGAAGQNGINHNNNNNNNNINNNNNLDYYNNNISSLNPNGRVHFNVGVMLLEAAARNDFDEVKRLLMLGVSPDSVNHDGLTALHQCCIDASEPMMNLLLEFGANVDAKDTEQWTPLHAACTCGHLNLVKILVEHGANLLAVNGDGNMPFDICEDEPTAEYIESQMVQKGITQEMIDFTRASTEMQMISSLEKQLSDGLDLDWADENGVTQLHIAAANGYLSVVKFLLQHAVNPNVCDNDLWRPLHGAACWGNDQHVKVIELLVEAGAHLDAKTINDETAFDLCDNAELLNRLNQLKDELESKQSHGIDCLKRTQSRTNSRVHSVRRTSVRDKNQISRREAREEAMLRVDSSSTPQSIVSTESNNLETTSIESQHQNLTTNTKQSSEDNTLNTDKNTSESSPKSESSTTSENQNPNSIDQVDSNNKTTSSCELFQQTDLNDISNLDEENNEVTISKQHTHRSQDSVVTSITTSEHNSSTNNNLLSTQTNNNSIVTTKVPAKSSATSLTLPSSSLPKINSHSLVVVNGKVRQKTVTTTTVNTHPNIGNDTKHNPIAGTDIKARHNESISTNDVGNESNSLNLAQQNQLTQSMLVQSIAPINYTLSNLKKQRSGIRMRTTSIGGGPVATSVIVVTANGHQYQPTSLDSQPSSNGTSNGSSQHQVNGSSSANFSENNHRRIESPGLTFRKFSGEPSEVVGSDGGGIKHKCCIVI